MIRARAQALLDALEDVEISGGSDACDREAEAAAALRAALADTSTVEVPREPTEAMCLAGESCEGGSSSKPWCDGGYTPENVEQIYRAMIAAVDAAKQGEG